jgi:peptidoglycan/LPS O-acetylase OafA/YrhL
MKRLRSSSVPDSRSYTEYRSNAYFRPLDGLRAVSVLLVLAYHVNSHTFVWLSGELGVAIFFVISGFLITTLALREEEDYGSVSLKAFYVRRACRIFPLYYLVLAIYIVLVVGFNLSNGRTLMVKSLPYYLFYANDFSPYLFNIGAPFTLSWTLAVEEKFYFVWPLLAFVILRRHRRLRFAVPVVLMLLPLVIRDLPADHALHYSQLAVGCALALVLGSPRGYALLSRVVRHWWLILSAFVVAHALMKPYGTSEFRVVYAPVVALMIASVVVAASPWARFLATRSMTFVGKRAYGFYLVQMLCLGACRDVLRRVDTGLTWNASSEPTGRHALLASLALFVIAGIATLAFSDVLHRLVERPLISVGRVWSKRLTGTVPVAPPRMTEGEEPALEVVEQPAAVAATPSTV